MEKQSYTQICMYLEVYTDRQFTHDEMECGKFAEACIMALVKNGCSDTALIDEFKSLQNKTMSEIGEERCNSLFEQVRKHVGSMGESVGSVTNKAISPEKRKASKKGVLILFIVIIIVASIGGGYFAIESIQEQQNKTFSNGIAGEYRMEVRNDYTYQIDYLYITITKDGRIQGDIYGIMIDDHLDYIGKFGESPPQLGIPYNTVSKKIYRDGTDEYGIKLLTVYYSKDDTISVGFSLHDEDDKIISIGNLKFGKIED